MYKGKYQKPAVTKHCRNKPGLLIISLVLLLAALAGGTVAYLLDYTSKVTNTFTPANVAVEIEEKFENNVKENVYIHNTSDIQVFVRVTLVEYWKNAAGEIVPPPAEPQFDWGGWKNAADPDWLQVGNIYYYKKPLDAESASYFTDDTSALIERVTVELPDGYKFYLDVHAEAVQAEPETVVGQAWTDVTVVNGQLTAKQEG